VKPRSAEVAGPTEIGRRIRRRSRDGVSKWRSSVDGDFNDDDHVSLTKDGMATGTVYYNYQLREFESDELPGSSVFYKNGNSDICRITVIGSVPTHIEMRRVA
jgi:predicted dithiol-disulfide oxidoreductase (DUF899 family)